MIGYEKFKKYIKALRMSNKATSELFQKYDDDGILDVTSADVICEMLMEMTGDDKRWIEHFLMNCDCDYDDGCAYWFDADGGKHEIDGDRDLYDLVTGKIEATDERLEPTYRLSDEYIKYLNEKGTI